MARPGRVADAGGWEIAIVGTGKVVGCQSQMFAVAAAAHPVGCLAHLLHGGYQQPHQHGNDGIHHQHFNESKTTALTGIIHASPEQRLNDPSRHKLEAFSF